MSYGDNGPPRSLDSLDEARPESPAAAVEALTEQRTQLQRTIARQVRMKRTPLLVFESDPAVAHGLRVEEILRNLRDANGDHDESGGDDAGTR